MRYEAISRYFVWKGLRMLAATLQKTIQTYTFYISHFCWTAVKEMSIQLTMKASIYTGPIEVIQH